MATGLCTVHVSSLSQTYPCLLLFYRPPSLSFLPQTHHCSAGPKPSPPSVPTTLAKLKALPELEVRRWSIDRQTVRTSIDHLLVVDCFLIDWLIDQSILLSPQHERESLLTKAVRLTAGLVLRNLIRTVPEARRLVMLAILASLIPRPLQNGTAGRVL